MTPLAATWSSGKLQRRGMDPGIFRSRSFSPRRQKYHSAATRGSKRCEMHHRESRFSLQHVGGLVAGVLSCWAIKPLCVAGRGREFCWYRNASVTRGNIAKVGAGVGASSTCCASCLWSVARRWVCWPVRGRSGSISKASLGIMPQDLTQSQ